MVSRSPVRGFRAGRGLRIRSSNTAKIRDVQATVAEQDRHHLAAERRRQSLTLRHGAATSVAG